jgi:predicted O-methyltransferase YrrM
MESEITMKTTSHRAIRCSLPVRSVCRDTPAVTMKRTLKKLVPKSLKKLIRTYQSKELELSVHLRESTRYTDIGEAGPLITDVFSRIKDLPGWFNVDDCGHFFLVLSYQSAMGVKGDLLEIGSYHGRSTALMAKCLQPGERIVVCDAFESYTDDYYANKPSPADLISNIKRLNQELEKDRIVIQKCWSNDLHLNNGETFRFIHIDGGHSAEQAYFDLNLCCEHLTLHGIIVMDDYYNKLWPGVTQGTDKFLNDSGTLSVLADLNRHGAHGRKLYLIQEHIA